MVERKTKYCSNCGEEIDARAKICVKCGVEQAPLVEKVSSIWYLFPFFFMIIGGVIAWAVNKDRDPKKARNFLIFGAIWSVIVGVIYVLFIVVLITFISSTCPSCYP